MMAILLENRGFHGVRDDSPAIRYSKIANSAGQGDEQVADFLLDFMRVSDRPANFLAKECAKPGPHAMRDHPRRPFAPADPAPSWRYDSASSSASSDDLSSSKSDDLSSSAISCRSRSRAMSSKVVAQRRR